jgi:hypothetical protein
MGRYYFDAKKTVEESTELSIFWLNNKGLLKGYCITDITWTRRHGVQSSAGLVIDVTSEQPYARLIYTITRYRDGSKEKYDYKIQLAKTRCNLGGVRYWFLCPHCGRRAGKLYRKPLGEMYLCRTCNNLTYRSRNRCVMAALGHTSRQKEKVRCEIKRWTWSGKPTRKVRKLRALELKEGILATQAWKQVEKLKTRIKYANP